MKKENWIWMPHPAHFILGDKCRFHLATYVGKYIVSTVGELWNERAVREIHAKIFNPEWYEKNQGKMGDIFDYAYFKEFGYEELGCHRTYETMVFKARKSKNKCCPYEIIVEKDLDLNSYNDPGEAYKGHLKLCKKWSK